jgi:tRNA (guanine37-N1)-methyltransferase
LVVEEGLRRGAWRTGPSRLLLLDEKYTGRGVDELPEAVKVLLISAALDIAGSL